MSLVALLFPCTAFGEAPVLDYDLSVEWHKLQSLESTARHSLPSPNRCRCLARDRQHLWVGTTAGALRWNLADNTSRLFKVQDDWGIEYAKRADLTGRYPKYNQAKVKIYLAKWVRNAVENIIILAPGKVWVETFNGAMVIQGDKRQVFASKEQALAALHKTDLRPMLGKIVSMDKAGHLWRTHRIGEFYLGRWGIRRFDGQQWKTMPQPAKKKPLESSIQRIVADRHGNLWACGGGGIYHRQKGRWEKVDLGKPSYARDSYDELYIGPSGTLWAFDMGRLARFDGKDWEVFRGRGRYKDFMLDVYSRPHRQALRVWEAPDGKFWFGVCELGLMCFDGKTFRAIPKIGGLTAIATSPNGQTFVSTGQRIFRYDKGEWKRLATPNTPAFKRPWTVEAETLTIYDLHAAEDETLYMATGNGLLKHKDKKWREMLFPRTAAPVKPGPPEIAPEMARHLQQLMQGIVAPELVNGTYKAYVEGDGRKLIQATDDQLADDVTKAKNPMSAMISYHRLRLRDAPRAEKSFEKRIRTVIAAHPQGGSWIIQMQLACHGPSAIKPLLELAKSSKGRRRALAVNALAMFQDKKVARELLKLVKDAETDGPTYLAIARAAILVGDPEGIDLLIEAATTEPGVAKPTGRAQSRPAEYEQIALQKYACDFLQNATTQYDDLPADWSRQKWQDWWKKHRATWKPTEAPTGIAPAAGLRLNDRIAQEIAKRLEAKTGRKKTPATK